MSQNLENSNEKFEYPNPYWGDKPFDFSSYSYVDPVKYIKDSKNNAWLKILDRISGREIDPRILSFTQAAKNRFGQDIAGVYVYRSPATSDYGFAQYLIGVKKPPVLPGLLSLHEYGEAVDVTLKKPERYREYKDFAKSFGLNALGDKMQNEDWHVDTNEAIPSVSFEINARRLPVAIPALMQKAWQNAEKQNNKLIAIKKNETVDEYVDRMVSQVADFQKLDRIFGHMGKKETYDDYDYGEVLAAQAQLAANYYIKKKGVEEVKRQLAKRKKV